MQIVEIATYVKNVTLNQPQYFKQPDSTTDIGINVQQEPTTVQRSDPHPTFRTNLLNKLIEATNRNATRKKGGYRYDSGLKKFATYLRMIAGPLSYDTIQRNLPGALPSLSSTNRYVQKMNCRLIEGIPRFDELKLYLEARNLPNIISLSEDATRIVGRVQYDRKTNQVIGFVQPLNRRNGMPVPFLFPARNAKEIMGYFEGNHTEAHFVNAIVAQPVSDHPAPAFCFMIFSSNSKYTNIDVINRWEFIISGLKRVGIVVLNVSTDSDTKYNAAMRKLSCLGDESNYFNDSNWYSLGPIKDATSMQEIDTIYSQDTTHIGCKLHCLILKTMKDDEKLPIGNYFIKQSHLWQLLDECRKDEHNLTPTTLRSIDKQNFNAVERICNAKVIELLRRKVPGSHGTIKFLEIMQYVIDSYMDKKLLPLQRVYKIWYATFILRLWRAFTVSKKGLTLKNNSLSTNCFVCVELNAHSLVKYLLQLKKINMPHLFTPHLLGSQPCEALFRQVRSFTTTYSTVANCSVKEILERISKIQLQNDITSSINNVYSFPRLECKNEKTEIHDLPSIKEIQTEIEKAKCDATNDAINLGLIGDLEAKKFDFSCRIKPYTYKPTPSSPEPKQSRNRCEIQLDKVKLKNFADQFVAEEVDELSSFVEIFRNKKGKRIIIKKTSFIWLLRNDPTRLSSDRLQRVMASIKIKIKKKTKVHSTIHKYLGRKMKRKKNARVYLK